MKKLIWIVVVVIILGIAGYFYVFHKPHRDISSESAEYTLASTELVGQYSDDRTVADSLYLDQTIVVSGSVKAFDSTSVQLEGGIYCNLVEAADITALSEGQEVQVKGRVVSYDDLFSEVRMDNCSILQE